jgi:hypothetical protein
MIMVNRTFDVSVRKLTLKGLTLNFPSGSHWVMEDSTISVQMTDHNHLEGALDQGIDT